MPFRGKRTKNADFGLKTRKCNKKCFFRHSDAFGVGWGGWGGKGNLFTVLSLWTNWRLRGDSNVEGVLTFYASQSIFIMFMT